MHALDMASGEPDGAVTLPIDLTGASVAGTVLGPVPAEWDADQALTALYSEHYRSLVRMAAFLVHDTDTAEDVGHASFGAEAPDSGERECAQASAGHAERGAGGHPPTGAPSDPGRSARATGAAAGSTRAAVLRGPLRSPDRRGHGDQPGSGS